MDDDDARLLIVNEYKNWKIGGPMVDQVVGSARRGQRRLGADIFGIVIWCRDYTDEAERRAAEHAEAEGIRVLLKRVGEDED